MDKFDMSSLKDSFYDEGQENTGRIATEEEQQAILAMHDTAFPVNHLFRNDYR